MNKPLAIAGATAGALCAFWLTVDVPSFGGMFSFGSCDRWSQGGSAVRALSWDGDDAVEIDVPGSVHFKAGPQWSAVVAGPAALLKHVRIRAGRIEFDRSFIYLCDTHLDIELTGPAVRHWNATSSGNLVLEQLNQTELDIVLSGSGSVRANGQFERTQAELSGSGRLQIDGGVQQNVDVELSGSGILTASGTAQHLRVALPGSGKANLGALTVKTAEVSLDGSGMVDVRAEDSADMQINGSGVIKLLQKPQSVRSQINGSGRIIGAG